ncbi:MAG: autoinducer binding domain-containing protein [Pseudomonadota bacterium]|nr:autoinducer binding domain-containing protein [Pseudomonadota bacterium]
MPDAPRRLQDVTTADGYAARALEVIQRVSSAEDDAAVIEVLYEAKQALGVEHAAFVSFVRDDDSKESFRFFLACDPVWCLKYQQQGWYAQDAWLLYAATNSEPICGSKIPLRTKAQREAQELAVRHGIVSAYLVPAPASGGLSRLGVLGLGSSQEGYFECEAVASLKLLARALAMELHEWWIRRVRQEIIATHRLKPDDLLLLAMERQGLSTKEIVEALGVSASSVDCRFQRLATKFNMPNRRATARLAAEYGLI